jgi:branched-chain amino acid transport system substrate-binding protein
VSASLAASGLGQLANIPFANAGVDFELLPVADEDPDMAATAHALADGFGALAVLGGASMCASLAEETAAQGLDLELLLIVTCAQPAAVEQVGADLFDGAKVFGHYDALSEYPEAVQYREVMAAYAPDTAAEEGLTVTGYQVMTGLVRALEDMTDDVDRDSIATTLRSSSGVLLPAGAGATFGCAADPIPLISASCSGDAIILTMADGVPVEPEVLDIAPLFSR